MHSVTIFFFFSIIQANIVTSTNQKLLLFQLDNPSSSNSSVEIIHHAKDSKYFSKHTLKVRFFLSFFKVVAEIFWWGRQVAKIVFYCFWQVYILTLNGFSRKKFLLSRIPVLISVFPGGHGFLSGKAKFFLILSHFYQRLFIVSWSRGRAYSANKSGHVIQFQNCSLASLPKRWSWPFKWPVRLV